MSRAVRPSSRKRGVISPRISGTLRDRVAIAGFLVLLVTFLGLVLIPGYRLANRVAADCAAVMLFCVHR